MTPLVKEMRVKWLILEIEKTREDTLGKHKLSEEDIKHQLNLFQKKDSQVWAHAMKRMLGQGDFSDYSESYKITVGELFKRYIKEGKHLGKKDHENIEYRVNNFFK